jgi:hypothetical protein
MHTRGTVLFIVLFVLAGAVAAVLIAEQRRSSRSESFQHIAGGLGFGPALDLSDCPFAFDPRLDGSCGQDYGPLPGGSCFCPHHAGSFFFYPPLTIRDNGDALSP